MDPDKRRSPHRVELRAEWGGGTGHYNCMLTEDVRFSVQLPPGSYNLSLIILKWEGATLHKKIPVQEGMVLRENENRVFNME